MKNSLKLIFSLASLVLLTAPVLRADEPVAPPADQSDRLERRREGREKLEQMIKELNLTPDQQSRVEAIHRQAADERRTIRADTTLGEDQKRSKLKELRKHTMGQVRALLTPDQRAKLKELRGKHGQHGQHGDQQPANPPPPGQ
jgi:Spy/CpxP family protein refolding chaperone